MRHLLPLLMHGGHYDTKYVVFEYILTEYILKAALVADKN